MYMACRHIKPNGVRCKSPALSGHAFCYFHSKLHSTTKRSFLDDFKLPVIEDTAALQVAISQICDALLSSRIDSKRAGQLLWAMQISSGNIPRKWMPWPDSVDSVTGTTEGDELAPELRICNGNDECEGCQYAETCPDYDPDDDDDDDDDD
jgi:hypothetical protein